MHGESLLYNKLQPVGRPIAASEVQQAQIRKHHKAGKSLRWIVEEMTLSLQTVRTVIAKQDGIDRTTGKRRPQARPRTQGERLAVG